MDRKSPYFQRKRGKAPARRFDNAPAKPGNPCEPEPPHHRAQPHPVVADPRRPPMGPSSSPVIIIDRRGIDPFDLFCALHLGITAEGGYRPQSPAEIARRFGMSCVQLQGKAAELGMDPETVRLSGFDIGLARYDIKVAPEGISRRELAKPWWDEFRAAVAVVQQKRAVGAAMSAVNPVGPAPVEIELKNPIFED